MNSFDNAAAEWDNNPIHKERSEEIVKAMMNLIPINNQWTALEYGAGTGIASFLLKDSLKKIILMDSSSEMIRVAQEKIARSDVKNLEPLFFNLEKEQFDSLKFDLIFSQMVLHHVTDIDLIISKFSSMLRKGGYLAITDLYKEDGSFHGEGFTGHNGFDINNLSGKLEKLKFKNINHKKCYTINRKISDGSMKQFDVFLLTGQL
jgi:tRNA (cmo5U34)-methyltransferase